MSEPTPVRLRDYTPPPFGVDTVELEFELGEDHTTVRSTLTLRRNPEHPGEPDLELDGRNLETRSVRLDGEALDRSRLHIGEERLTVKGIGERARLETEVRIRPRENTSLEGLYTSAGNYCTQCEAEGFRKITWFPDRPDVMARYRTTIVADAQRFPVLLSNGNLVERADLTDGRHRATWEDPYAKPSYLFALVAGDLHCHEDTFVTASGREVALRIYVEPHNHDRCEHAMTSLKKSMRWDEEVYGLQYDLDVFMLVAVDDFNMGAMENKGLNIFNSKYVLARPETATDRDYASIEGVVAHEYFHNWTGNRVTCRDWFQLSLKEGLTVFRDQQFSADMGSPALKRIQDVRILRAHQFPEDAGPMAHPVRPAEYLEISNFYTTTIYNKGAEVIRMLHTLLGAKRFRAGIDLYLERHDGEAVTIEDFVCAMEDASGTALGQFRRWYDQAGTPRIEVETTHDAALGTFDIGLGQHCDPTPGQPDKQPLHVPVRLKLFDRDGGTHPAMAQLGTSGDSGEVLLELTDKRRELRINGVATPPVVSVGRGFAAPVRIDIAREPEDLAFLMGHDDDPFSRWDAAQEYATHVIEEAMSGAAEPAPRFVEAFRRTLVDPDLDPALIAEALALPGEQTIADRREVVDPDAIHAARGAVRAALSTSLEAQFREIYHRHQTNEPYRFDAPSVARRSLKNLCLRYLAELPDGTGIETAQSQFATADNMTDTLAALACLADFDCEARAQALGAFEEKWRDDPLVLDKWFAIQAMSSAPDALDTVVALTSHPRFEIRNPNRVRSLIGAFAHGNAVRFHDRAGRGYRFLAGKVIEIDPANPQVAARALGAFSQWRRYDEARQHLLREQLERVLAVPGLSKDSFEVATRLLG